VKVAIDARYIHTTEREVLPAGGIGRYVRHVIDELLELDESLQLRLVVPATNGRPIVLGRHAARVEERRFAPAAQSVGTFLTFSYLVDLQGVDVLHCPANVLPLGTTRPAVTTIHDLMWLEQPELCQASWLTRPFAGMYFRAGIRTAARCSREIATVSEHSKNVLLARFPALAGRVTVVPHGLDPGIARLEPAAAERLTSDLVPGGTPFVLCVGQGAPYKNHALAITAFADAFAREPDMRLVMVRRASHSDNDILQAIRAANLGQRLVLLPNVREEQLLALYSRARIFCFPSLCEGFGMPLLEAMACGAPVLTANFGAMAEVCGGAGLGVDTRSVTAVSEGLRRLHGDESLRTALTSAGHRRTKDFSWRQAAERTLAVYARAAR
jgi:glycosyltransferase involved in cell wall biosynthesis